MAGSHERRKQVGAHETRGPRYENAHGGESTLRVMNSSPEITGLIGDRYQIEGLIASGGMGSVYRARDTVLDRVVALKVLRDDGGDPVFVERFRAEATNAARLGHPNIVAVYDFGDADGRPYMAMEFVDGQTLREVLHAKRVLRPEHATQIAMQVASALEHARRAGIVHRDVKPENILIGTSGHVKVADFGLSRALAASRATQAESVVGTAQYIAPEQVQGRDADHRADIYALGVVLFEMLTGRAPFTGDSPAAVAYMRVGDDVPSPSSVNPAVPDSLDAIVANATARDPDERYPTPGALADALRMTLPTTPSGELGLLVHHTQTIPINTQPTVAISRAQRRAAAARRKRSKRRLIAIATALGVLFATLLAFTVGPLRSATVPSVVTRSQEDAVKLLRARGFDADVVLRKDDAVPAGFVIRQAPVSDARARTGSAVQIVVSLGPELIAMPDVRTKEFIDAEAELRDRGFTDVERVDVFNDAPTLQVVSQDPDAGVLVRKDRRITLRVSKGAELVAVPNVVSDPEDGARADLIDAGFKVVIERIESAEQPSGAVISQSPKGGARAKKGSTVKLVVSKGPPLVVVPDLRCMTRRQAEDALAHAGFKASIQGKGKRVVDQAPAPRGHAPKGSTITAYLGFGSFC